MSVVSSASSIDWNIVAGGLGTFIVTTILTWQGFVRGRKRVEGGKSEITSIVGATMMETATVNKLSDALADNTRAVQAQTVATQRQIDVEILTHRK